MSVVDLDPLLKASLDIASDIKAKGGPRPGNKLEEAFYEMGEAAGFSEEEIEYAAKDKRPVLKGLEKFIK